MTFDDFKDGDWVIYYNHAHMWHSMRFQAYKSKHTFNAFRLKYGERELLVDIGEIRPISSANEIMHEEAQRLHNQVDNGNSD